MSQPFLRAQSQGDIKHGFQTTKRFEVKKYKGSLFDVLSTHGIDKHHEFVDHCRSIFFFSSNIPIDCLTMIEKQKYIFIS